MSRSDDTQDSVLDDGLVAAISAAVAPGGLSDERRARMRRRVLDGAATPARNMTLRAEEGEWEELLPKVHRKILRVDFENKNQTALYRLEPGAALPAHPHEQEEECLILEGEIRFGELSLGAGDYHLAHAGNDHPVLSSPQGALLLIRQAIAA